MFGFGFSVFIFFLPPPDLHFLVCFLLRQRFNFLETLDLLGIFDLLDRFILLFLRLVFAIIVSLFYNILRLKFEYIGINFYIFAKY